MANTLNTGVYKEEYTTRLQERLNRPTTWKEVCDVVYTDAQIVNVPYMSTVFSVQTGTRGTAYGFSDFALTNETLTINTYRTVPVFIDRGDLAQCSYVNQMEIADRQAALINENVEAGVLDDHANWRNIGDSAGVVTDNVTGQITVSANNISTIVRGVRRIILANNGGEMMDRYGLFFVWSPTHFEFLEQFAQANGFNLADAALKEGLQPRGYFLLGAYHYVSNDNVANHVFCGIRKLMKVGILNATYGVPMIDDKDPNLQSGISIVDRVDYGTLTPTGYNTILCDLNVAN